MKRKRVGRIQLDGTMNSKARQKFVAEITAMEEVMGLWVQSLRPPVLYHSGHVHYGFRFGSPGAAHYCMLKIVSAISCLNAAMCLADKAFLNEICMLHRVIVDCCSHVEYIVSGLSNGKLDEPQKQLVDDYFADYRRNSSDDFKRPKAKISQATVHKVVARDKKERLSKVEGAEFYRDMDTAKLMSNVYLTFSNYVHCRYPEVMDLLGGEPPKFLMNGHTSPRKIDEARQHVETAIETVSLTFKQVIQDCGFAPILQADPKWSEWLKVT